jgi:antitoxin FitA
VISITLKAIPRPLHAALKARARQHGRSLNKEALACLEAAVAPAKVSTEDLLAELRRHRASVAGQLDEAFLRDARRSGRP